MLKSVQKVDENEWKWMKLSDYGAARGEYLSKKQPICQYGVFWNWRTLSEIFRQYQWHTKFWNCLSSLFWFWNCLSWKGQSNSFLFVPGLIWRHISYFSSKDLDFSRVSNFLSIIASQQSGWSSWSASSTSFFISTTDSNLISGEKKIYL